MHDYTKYFKDQKGFDRFINLLYSKYKSLSKFSGTIKLEDINLEEAKVFSKLMGNNYISGDTLKISIKKFIEIMNNSKYTEFDIKVLVEEYLNVKLVTKKEEYSSKEIAEKDFYQSIISTNSLGSVWLKNVVSLKLVPYKLIHQRYNKNKILLKKELINIIKLIDNLPKEKILLTIYSSLYTKNPHYLDLDNNHSNLFFYALAYIKEINYPNSREDKIKLLSMCNIEIDNISNFAITYNLLADKEYINMFSKNKESLILNIQNIINVKYFDTREKIVFVFENPSILTEIMSKNMDVSVIISGGFPNTSVHLLIEKLIDKGNKIYYNGDYDPEGLLIASKLKEKYNEKLTLFCYHEDDYNNCLSKKKISNTRLKKLVKVNNKELLKIKELLLINKCSAYQENNKDRIIEFIKGVVVDEK